MKLTAVRLAFAAIFFSLISHTSFAIDLYFEDQIHDPSTIVEDNGTYWTFGTGGGIITRYSQDLLSWQIDDEVFHNDTEPAWVKNLDGWTGDLWAPDIIFMNNKWYLYYSVPGSRNGGTQIVNAVGVAVSDSLNNPSWTDLGSVVHSDTEPLSSAGEPTNCIDPGLFRDANGTVWMLYGSHYAGIFMVEIDPTTGKRVNATRYPIVGNGGAWNEYEGAQITYINGYYYCFVNLGECCAGDQSTYYIVVGRSTSVTGPYLDANGVDLWNYGGTTVLDDVGTRIGPGHYGYLNNGGQNLVSIHYYDGTTANGWPARLDLLEMSFDANDWPVLTRDFTISGASAPTVVDANLVDGGTYTITAAHSGKNVHVKPSRGGSCTGVGDGSNVEQQSANGSLCQEFVFMKMRDKNGNITEHTKYYWTIHPAGSTGQAMDNTNFSQLNGNNIITWSFLNNEAQQWRLIDKGNGNYEILTRSSGRVLNVANSSTADGANIEQWESQGWTSQQFFFTDVNGGGGGGDTTPPAAPSNLLATAASSSQIDLNWDDNTESDLASYNVYRGGSLIASGVTSSQYSDTGLSASTQYCYTVTAVDSSGNESAQSSQACATTNSGGTATIMFVSDIVPTTVNAGGGQKSGQVAVTILDDTGAAVSGATVTGTFTGDFNETVSADTDTNGVATLTTTGTKRGGVTFTFCVDDVTGTLTYDSTQNVETCDGI